MKTMTTSHPAALATQEHLVALDIDGTLADGGLIPDITATAVRDVVTAGHHLVLATGRSLVGVAPVIKRLGLRSGRVICSNGAVTARINGRRLVVEDVVSFDAGPAMRRVCAAIPDVLMASEALGKGYRVNVRFPDELLAGRQYTVWRERDLWAVPTTRAVVFAPDVTSMAHELRPFDVTATPGSTVVGDWLDLTAPNLSKATALEAVRRRVLVAPEHTVAVGDGHNDLSMLKWAARGVAMAGAPAEVRATADEVCGSIAEHGAVGVLRAMAEMP